MIIVRGDQLDFEPASHEDPADPGVLKRVLAKKAHLIEGRVQMINWARIPQGKSFQPHYHEDMQEVFIILNGEVELTAGDLTSQLSGGDAALIEPREIHTMKNVCQQDVDFIALGISTESGGKTVCLPS